MVRLIRQTYPLKIRYCMFPKSQTVKLWNGCTSFWMFSEQCGNRWWCLLICPIHETLAAYVLIKHLVCSWVYQIHCNVIFIWNWNSLQKTEFLKMLLRLSFEWDTFVAFIPDVWWEHWNAEIHEKLEFRGLHSSTADIPVLHRTPRKFQCETVPSLRSLRFPTSHIRLTRFPADSKEENSLCTGTVFSNWFII